MQNRILPFTLLFLGVVAAQALLFDNIQLWGYLNPYPYCLFVLLLPVNTPKNLQLTLAFALGIVIDILSSTLGLHAAATTLIAFLRPYLIDTLQTRQFYGKEIIPSMRQMGFSWTARYTLILIAIHHLTLFLLTATSLANILNSLLRATINTLLTSAIIILAQLFLFASSNKVSRP